MITYVEFEPDNFEVKAGTAVLGHIWKEKSFWSSKVQWSVRSTFLSETGARFGGSFDSIEEAKAAMETLCKSLLTILGS